MIHTKAASSDYHLNALIDLIGHSEDCRYSFSCSLAKITRKVRECDAAYPEGDLSSR